MNLYEALTTTNMRNLGVIGDCDMPFCGRSGMILYAVIDDEDEKACRSCVMEYAERLTTHTLSP